MTDDSRLNVGNVGDPGVDHEALLTPAIANFRPPPVGQQPTIRFHKLLALLIGKRSCFVSE